MFVIYVDNNQTQHIAEIFSKGGIYYCSIFPGHVTANKMDNGFIKYSYYHHNDAIESTTRGEQVCKSKEINYINIASMFMPANYLLVKPF